MSVDVALMVYSLRGGGVERMRVHLAEGLERRGYGTAIVVARADGPYRSFPVPPSVRLIDLKANSWKAWLDALTNYLAQEKPRVALAAMETAGVLALLARRRAGVATPIVVSSHVAISRHIKSEPKRLKRLIIPHLVRWLYRRADGIVAVSNGVADDLARFAHLSRQRIQVIYNPVVTDDLLEAARAEPQDKSLVDTEHPLVLGVGRLTRQKDFCTLIHALALVRQHRPARLVILGEGEERASLEACSRKLGLEEFVQMPGFAANPFAYMARASSFVLSSAWEGLPGVLIQALACGCPVVSTDCPSGPGEILEGGKYGRLVPVGDHKTMAQAILDTLDNPPDRRMLQERAMDFHVDKIIDQYLELTAMNELKRCGAVLHQTLGSLSPAAGSACR